MTAASSTIIHSVQGNTYPNNKSDVFEIYNPSMVKGEKADRRQVDLNHVQHALNTVIKKMGAENDIGKAWENILIGITKHSKIAIKINVLRQFNGPQFETLAAVVYGLTSMFNCSYPASNIFVFDRHTEDVDNQYGSDKLDKLGIWHDKVDYNGKNIKVVNNNMYIATVFSEADYGINMVASRKHQFFAGHLSGVIKNMMGALSTRRDRYGTLRNTTGGEFHDNSNYQSFIDMYKNYFRGNITLYIVDHILIPEHEGKRYYSKKGSRLLIGSDPCAVDSRTVDIINNMFEYDRINAPTKKVPKALAEAGIGTIGYNLHKFQVN